MLRSSLGFHTLTLSYISFSSETKYLISDFKRYSKETGAIQIYEDHGNTRIKFLNRAKGIEWLIRSDVYLQNLGVAVDIIETTINPKILGGIHDYITAATYDDMEAAIENFNRISSCISPGLGRFEDYSLKRVDYCINFSLNELAPGCTYDQMMKLIKQSDIPPHYKEWMEYDTTSHRKKTRPGSFYLTNGSVHINCYSKYMKYEDQSQKNIARGYPPIPQETKDAARDIIRFEVQCKYLKTYTLSDKAKKAGNNNPNKYESLLSRVACIDIIGKYYKKAIGRGDWYTLQEAIRMIQLNHFNSQKEERLIKALKLVNDCRSVAKAKEAYQGSDLDTFKRTLKDLSNLGINPVTIPREWGIKHIPSLLYAYSDKVSEERMKADTEKFQMECVKEYLHHKKSSSSGSY